MAAGFSPQMRFDPQPLCHLHVVRWVDVVEHAAAGQLHLNGGTATHQSPTLRAQTAKRVQVQLTHMGRAKKKNQYML